MACGVVVGRGVARNGDPSLLVLVVSLILAQPAWGITVVAEDHGLVVQRHPGDGVALPSGAGGPRAPRVSAQQLWRRGSKGRGGRTNRGGQADTAGQSKQLTAADERGAFIGLVGRGRAHGPHDTGAIAA